MSTSRRIGLVAILLFAISHFLPAFGGLRGYACFHECWETMTKHDMSELGGWLYYSGFVLSNTLFLVLGGSLFLTGKGRFLRLLASRIILLHTISWLFLNVKGLSNIEVGYYVWLTAYALLVIAHLTKESNREDLQAGRPRRYGRVVAVRSFGSGAFCV